MKKYMGWLGDMVENLREGRRPVARQRRPRELAFDELESRLAPATYTVTSLGDVSNSSDGVLSLREAIQASNDAGGSNSIVFSAALGTQNNGFGRGVIRLTQTSDTVWGNSAL